MPKINNPLNLDVNANLTPIINKLARKRPYYEFDVEDSSSYAVFINGELVGKLRSTKQYANASGTVDYYCIDSPNTINNSRKLHWQRNTESVTTKESSAIRLGLEHFVLQPSAARKKGFCDQILAYYNNAKYVIEAKMDKVTRDIVTERSKAQAITGVYYHQNEWSMHSILTSVLTGTLDLRTYMASIVDIDDYLKWNLLVTEYRNIVKRANEEGLYVEFLPRTNAVRVYDQTHWARPSHRGLFLGSEADRVAPYLYRSYETLPPEVMQPIAMLQISGGTQPVLGVGAKIDETLYYIEESAVKVN